VVGEGDGVLDQGFGARVGVGAAHGGGGGAAARSSIFCLDPQPVRKTSSANAVFFTESPLAPRRNSIG